MAFSHLLLTIRQSVQHELVLTLGPVIHVVH